eukprot:TRINITY_DN164_c0_g1_i9.p1 TRINITY_DN164_c0_g1~~TRINITY_DN164_c0_g1_i9.p1  ORF type:complete len:235 (-),score=31.59 TRINITY_DN164_c0_g1_i9:115-819(-)
MGINAAKLRRGCCFAGAQFGDHDVLNEVRPETSPRSPSAKLELKNNTEKLELGSPRKQKHILVIGAGVIGLTTALKLCEAGFKVTVVATEFAPPKDAVGGYTSVVAGALWEYPPGVCGRHHDEVSLERSKFWSLESYNMYLDQWKEKIPGVSMLKSNFYFRFNLDDDDLEVEKMNALRENTLGFKRGLEEHRVCDGIELDLDDDIKDAYSWLSPHIDSNAYMEWLTNLVKIKKM